MDKINQKHTNIVIYFLIGFTSIISQVIFIREFMIAFYGNELTVGLVLAFWLGWIAIGSISFNKLFGRITNYYRLIPIFLLLISLLLPSTVYLIRITRTVLISISGELPELFPTIINTAIIISPVCLISGAFFALASKYHSSDSAFATSIVYKYEAIGSAIGGILLSFVLLENLNSFQIMLFLSFLNALLAFTLLWNRTTKIVKVILVTLCVAFVTISGNLGTELHLKTTLEFWKNYKFLESKDSVYGHNSVVEFDGEKSIYSNGIRLMSSGNVAVSEELVHYGMLQHESPESVLLVGSSHPNVFTEISKYNSVKKIDYVELDPVITELSQKYFADSWELVKDKINVINQDGRYYLNQTTNEYDIVILNAGDPLNANINRYYTKEFFDKVKSQLTTSGIFTFQLTSSENYISDDLKEFLQTINKSLNEVFPAVKIIPGETIHFFAANDTKILNLQLEFLITQLINQGIENQFVNKYYLHFKILPERINEVEKLIEPQHSTRINRDFEPIAYFFNLIFWSSQFSSLFNSLSNNINSLSFNWIFILTILLMFILFCLAFVNRKKNLNQQNTKITVFILGISLITIEIIILLGYQAIYGYIYNQMAILIGFFMAGIGLGSGYFLKQKLVDINSYYKRLFLVQNILAFLPFIALAIFQIESSILSQILIFFFSLICGLVGGYLFPLASRIFFSSNQNIGILYGLDVFGAMVGTVIFGIICIPFYGFLRVAILIFVINITTSLFIKISTKSKIYINS